MKPTLAAARTRQVSVHIARVLSPVMLAVLAAAGAPAMADGTTFFIPGNLVVSVEGNGVMGATSGSYTDNQAAPLSLFQFQLSGTSSASYVNSLVLPQTSSGSNFVVSGEYGSSSEGSLQLSGNGQYLTIAGYGVNAAAFNANPGAYSPNSSNTALGQSGSMTGQSYTAVPRVVALIDSNGSVNSSTALYNVFNANNPRSVYSADGTSVYVSGQGTSGDATGGVFYSAVGAATTAPTSITGADAGSGASQDTRFVTAYNGQLYVSVDSKSGATNRSFIGSLGSSGTLPTSVANGANGPAQLTGFGATNGLYTITSTNGNTLNAAGQKINLSPANYLFANATTLYVADTGAPKNSKGNTSSVGDGGLQKWSLVNGSWTLDYTLSVGLNLVANGSAAGTTGLLGLTGQQVMVNGVAEEELFATNYTVGDTDATYLYGITDVLGATTAQGGEQFTQLAAAPADSNFKGVSFAPTTLAAAVPEPAPFALFAAGLVGVGVIVRRKRVN